MLQPFMSADLCHAAFRSKISSENHETASRLQWLVERNNHFLSRSLDRALRLSTNREARNGLRRRMQVIAAQQSPRQQPNAAGAMHVRGDKASRRFQVSEQRSPSAHRLKIINLQLDARLARNCQQMKNCVGRPASRRDGSDPILESIPRQNVAGLDSLLQHVHHNLAAVE